MDQRELLLTLMSYLNSFGETENFIDWAVNCEEEKDEEKLREAVEKVNNYEFESF